MNVKKVIIPAIILAMAFSLIAPQGFAQSQKEKPKQGKAEEKIFIPKEVKSVLQEGMEARQGRQDIPVSVTDSLFIPARENFHVIFFLKIKNSELGFAPAGSAVPVEPAVNAGKKSRPDQETPVQEIAPAGQLQASFNVFLQFNRLEEGAQPQITRELYVPTTIQLENPADAEKEDIYNIGYPVPAGRYLLAIAVTSLNLQKIGTAYYEFSLPDQASFTAALDTTPIFFVKNIDQVEAPETRTTLHRGFFSFSVLKIVPNLEKVFAPGENLDIFFYVFGAKPNEPQPGEQPQWSIEINFEVKKGEEELIRWSPQAYTSPLVSQPLPLKQTVKIKDEKGERTEQRDLTPGSYTLVIKMLDKISALTGTKTIDFELK